MLAKPFGVPGLSEGSGPLRSQLSGAQESPGGVPSPARSSSAFSSCTGFRGDRGPLTLLLIDLLADKVHAVSALGAEEIMSRAVGAQKSLIVALEDRKGPLVLDLEAGSRSATHPVGTGELALIARLLKDAPSHLEGDVPRLRRRARLTVTVSNLARARFVAGCPTPSLALKPAFMPLLRILPLQRVFRSSRHAARRGT